MEGNASVLRSEMVMEAKAKRKRATMCEDEDGNCEVNAMTDGTPPKHNQAGRQCKKEIKTSLNVPLPIYSKKATGKSIVPLLNVFRPDDPAPDDMPNQLLTPLRERKRPCKNDAVIVPLSVTQNLSPKLLIRRTPPNQKPI